MCVGIITLKKKKKKKKKITSEMKKVVNQFGGDDSYKSVGFLYPVKRLSVQRQQSVMLLKKKKERNGKKIL